jgi:hypothetical protein
VKLAFGGEQWGNIKVPTNVRRTFIPKPIIQYFTSSLLNFFGVNYGSFGVNPSGVNLIKLLWSKFTGTFVS